MVRQRDGSLAARYNVCMHRGNRLREPGRGHAERFACPFHGWQYGIDGTLLLRARSRRAFRRACPPSGSASGPCAARAGPASCS